MIAQYPGTSCVVCGKSIRVGSDMQGKRGAWRHATCQPVEIPKDAITLSGGSGHGCKGWQKGQVIANKGRRLGSTWHRNLATISPRVDAQMAAWRKVHPVPNDGTYRAWEEERKGEEARLQDIERQTFPDNDGPEFLFVLQASAQSVREDGLSFGVGEDSGYLYRAACRPATEEEAAPARERLAKQERAKQATEQLAQLVRRFVTEGEYVPREGEGLILDGERVDVGEGQTAYGGGSWFVIQGEWIWYVQNRGGDGDDWGHNNVRTGGAGAIGRRLPYSPELAALVRELAPYGR